jgi:hypothetical protein
VRQPAAGRSDSPGLGRYAKLATIWPDAVVVPILPEMSGEETDPAKGSIQARAAEPLDLPVMGSCLF